MAQLREIYQQSKFDITKFFKPENKNNNDYLVHFLEDKNLSSLLPTLTYGKQIEEMIKSSDFEHTLRWFDENVPEDVASDVPFCRVLVGCILQQIFSGTNPKEEAQEVQFRTYSGLLNKLDLESGNVQLNILLEVQRFCSNLKFPKGLIERIFRYLMDTHVVVRKIFIKWNEDGIQDSTSPGREEALRQTSNWLSTLQSQPSESLDEYDDDLEEEEEEEEES